MKRVFCLLISISSVFMLLSCSNRDNRLDNFSIESIKKLLVNNYEISYLTNDEVNSIKLTDNVFYVHLSNEEKTYTRKDNHFYDSSMNFNCDEDVQMAVDYIVENYMYSYAQYLNKNELIFVKEYKDKNKNNGYDHYYEYKTEYSKTNDGSSGLIFYINADNGIVLEKKAFGPNKDLLLRKGETKVTKLEIL